MNLLLIGPRASGKTSVGRALARALGRTFVDLDDRVLARFEVATVGEVWRRHGEPAWRAAEEAALAEVLAQDDQVVALGGGTPMIPAAREAIDTDRRNGRARSVYLRCRTETLVARLRTAAGDRPSLTGADVATEVAAVLAAREATYEAVADAICAADGPVEDVVDRLLERSEPG